MASLNLVDLPVEVLEMIFNFCSYSELSCLRAVCRTFYHVCININKLAVKKLINLTNGLIISNEVPIIIDSPLGLFIPDVSVCQALNNCLLELQHTLCIIMNHNDSIPWEIIDEAHRVVRLFMGNNISVLLHIKMTYILRRITSWFIKCSIKKRKIVAALEDPLRSDSVEVAEEAAEHLNKNMKKPSSRLQSVEVNGTKSWKRLKLSTWRRK